jgi:hypothetical protein
MDDQERDQEHHSVYTSNSPTGPPQTLRNHSYCWGFDASLSVEVTGFEPLAPTLRTYPTVFGSPWYVWVS